MEAFVRKGSSEDFISLTPSNNYLAGLSARERKKTGGIQLRAIRLVSPDGEVSVLLTNMLNKSQFEREEIIDLYFRPRAVEDHCRNEKIVLEIEKFHGKTPNSIRQELYAVVIMSVIARTLMVLTSRLYCPKTAESQFNNAVMPLTSEAAVFVPDDPDRVIEIFSQLLKAIKRVRYYRSKITEASQPRITKRPPDKWCSGRQEKLKNA